MVVSSLKTRGVMCHSDILFLYKSQKYSVKSCPPVPLIERWRQEDHELKVITSYTISLRLTWDSTSKTKKKVLFM